MSVSRLSSLCQIYQECSESSESAENLISKLPEDMRSKISACMSENTTGSSENVRLELALRNVVVDFYNSNAEDVKSRIETMISDYKCLSTQLYWDPRPMTIYDFNNKPSKIRRLDREDLLLKFMQYVDVEQKLEIWAGDQKNRISAKQIILNFIADPDCSFIDLTGLNLSSLPDVFGEYEIRSKLIHLILSNNNLDDLPPSVFELTDLEDLNLDRNEFEKLPEGLTSLRNLSILSVMNNKLTELPDSLGDLTNLMVLKLDFNDLDSVPESFRNLANLQYLHLCVNKFKSIPDAICFLTSLKELNMKMNEIDSLPKLIGKLSELEVLDVSFNKLKDLPDSINNLLKLKAIHIDGNSIEGLKASLLSNNPTCRVFW